MVTIERSTRKPRQIGLTPLIDVVFLLIIFFMLSTNFIRTESMELSFPKASEIKPKQEKKVTAIRVYIVNEERLFMDNQELSYSELKAQLSRSLFENPDRSVLLLSGEKVSVQRLVTVMDDIYRMGGKNVAVANWKNGTLGGPLIEEPAEEATENVGAK